MHLTSNNRLFTSLSSLIHLITGCSKLDHRRRRSLPGTPDTGGDHADRDLVDVNTVAIPTLLGGRGERGGAGQDLHNPETQNSGYPASAKFPEQAMPRIQGDLRRHSARADADEVGWPSWASTNVLGFSVG